MRGAEGAPCGKPLPWIDPTAGDARLTRVMIVVAMPKRDELTGRIIGAALDVHRILGVGLLEQTYAQCLAWELRQRGLTVEQECGVPVTYKTVRLELGYRIDLLVEGAAIVEVKAVERLHPVHHAQLLTYLRLTGLTRGLLLNFNTALLRDGIHRVVLEYPG